MSKTIKAVNIQRKCYTMATVNNNSAVIDMYGDIVEKQPTNWWGEPIDGQYILKNEFLEDLQKIENCSNITIRMDSCGGDASVAIFIHNRLRELVANGANLTCIVDGVAMSGGSLIMCACNPVKVNPSSLVMIHKCWQFLYGGYNADELRSIAATNDAYDKSQISIYKRKSKLSETVISHMMGDTTYMTGKEAVDKGFADELLDDAEPLDIAASADRRSIFVRGREMHLSPGMLVPDGIPTVKSVESTADETNKSTTPVTPAGTEGGDEMPKTVETVDELRAEYPELVKEIEAAAAAESASADEQISAAIKAERDRIKAIDEVAGLFDDELVQAAKYGDKPCTAQELAYQAAQNAAANGKKFMSSLESDAEASKANEVTAVPGDGAGSDGEETLDDNARMANARKQVSNLLGKKGKEE